jgi:hypothetical protein
MLWPGLDLVAFVWFGAHSNAIKFTESGSVGLSLRLLPIAEAQQNGLTIFVSPSARDPEISSPITPLSDPATPPAHVRSIPLLASPASSGMAAATSPSGPAAGAASSRKESKELEIIIDATPKSPNDVSSNTSTYIGDPTPRHPNGWVAIELRVSDTVCRLVTDLFHDIFV